MLSRKHLLLAAFLGFAAACGAHAQADLPAASLESFGGIGKEEFVLAGGKEALLFEHTGKGCLTHMWFGGDWKGYDRTRIRVYVDGEITASIDMELFMGHGIGFADDAAPWGTKRIGKTGHPSGIYNTYRIPFGSHVRVTAQLAPGINEDPPFWWIIRGIENMPVEIGGIRLPDDARLKLYKTEDRPLAPLEMTNICETKNAGMLYQVTLSVKSGNLNFLEAVMRAYLDDSEVPLLLSSGTEDYFLGTYYFNRGTYHLEEAGVTHLDEVHGEQHFSAYRFHENDPVLFQKGMRLVWRNGEAKPDGTPYGDPKQSELKSYVWAYEWPQH